MFPGTPAKIVAPGFDIKGVVETRQFQARFDNLEMPAGRTDADKLHHRFPGFSGICSTRFLTLLPAMVRGGDHAVFAIPDQGYLVTLKAPWDVSRSPLKSGWRARRGGTIFH